MKITILNGSPKGPLSVTMQYVNYIMKKFPAHEYETINISQPIKKIEKDKKAFDEIIRKVRDSDGVIWATPVYYLLVPSQYKRFIELIFERKVQSAFRGKYAAVIITSIHFFDHISRNYLHGICDDLDMKYAGAFNPDMYDLMRGINRKKVETFGSMFFSAIETKARMPRFYPRIVNRSRPYKPGAVKKPLDPGGSIVAVITDCSDPKSNIGKMIERFSRAMSGMVKIININDMDAKAGCTGCCRCGMDNICIHHDNFADTYDSQVKTADIIIFAGRIIDRYLSSDWKLFMDRSFYNGHAPMLPEKQFGVLVSGPLGQVPGLRDIFEAMVEMQGSNLAGFVSDEADSATTDALIDGLAARLLECAAADYFQPMSFLGVGGKKIFRDDIWGRLRFVFQRDHEYYKKHGMYDFPQKDYKTRRMNLIMMLLTKIPGFRNEIEKRIASEMVKPLQNVVKYK